MSTDSVVPNCEFPFTLLSVRRLSLSHWIMIAMVLGILFGWLCPQQAVQTKIISTLFLHLIKCIIVPLLFSTLVVGITGHTDDLKSVGRLAVKSLIYFEIVTTLGAVYRFGFGEPRAPGRRRAACRVGQHWKTTGIHGSHI